MLASQRAYRDAVSWIRRARPRRVGRWRFASRAFGVSFIAGLASLSTIALVSASSFGIPGRDAWRTGWPAYLLLGLIAAALTLGWSRRRYLRWLYDRAREPLLRPLDDDTNYRPAVDALSSCPSPFVARFQIGWIAGPIAVWFLGVVFAISAAYFVVDGIISRGDVHWLLVAFSAGNAALSLVVFALVAPRLSTLRLATSAYKTVAMGYPE